MWAIPSTSLLQPEDLIVASVAAKGGKSIIMFYLIYSFALIYVTGLEGISLPAWLNNWLTVWQSGWCCTGGPHADLRAERLQSAGSVWTLNTVSYIPASVGSVARTPPVAVVAIATLRTQADITRFARVTRLANTGAAGVVTLAVVLAATRVHAAVAIGTDGTLVLTPLGSRRHSRRNEEISCQFSATSFHLFI